MSDTTIEQVKSKIAALERAVNTHETLREERGRRLEELRPKRANCEQESLEKFGVPIKDLPAWQQSQLVKLSAEADEVQRALQEATADGE